jgi:hypothetical protein
LFLSGTLGMEMLGGLYVEKHGDNHFSYALIANGEESLELLGLVVFLHALMDLLRKKQSLARDVPLAEPRSDPPRSLHHVPTGPS